MTRKTQNVGGLVGLLGFLYLQLVGQLIFGLESRDGCDFRLFALHQPFHQLVVIFVFLFFVFTGLNSFGGFGIRL